MDTRIGFIGLGMMGQGMAANLLAKGFPLVAMAHRKRAPLDALTVGGATEAPTAAAVAEASDVVILCVTGSPEVEAVMAGADGLLAGVREGMTIVDCSTAEPDSTERIAAELAARGVDFADAPLARSPKEAQEGRLNTMVGATDETFAKIRPILEAFCENILHVGPVGSGHKIKLIYNFMTQGHVAMIAEALSACAATGTDPKAFYELVTAGGANCGIFQMIVPKVLESGDYDGLGFSLANARKDLHYYNRLLGGAPMAAPVGAAVLQSLTQALAHGYGDRMVGALIEAQAKLNGLREA